MKTPSRIPYIFAVVSICCTCGFSQGTVKPKIVNFANSKDSFFTVESISPGSLSSFFPGLSEGTAAEIKQNQDLIALPYVTDDFIISSASADGHITWLKSLFTARNQTIKAVQYHTQYQQGAVDGKETKIGYYIGMEITAISNEANLNLDGIFAIGLASKASKLNGRIRLVVLGLIGSGINEANLSVKDLSPNSIIQALEQLAVLKSKIGTDKLYIYPVELPPTIASALGN